MSRVGEVPAKKKNMARSLNQLKIKENLEVHRRNKRANELSEKLLVQSNLHVEVVWSIVNDVFCLFAYIFRWHWVFNIVRWLDHNSNISALCVACWFRRIQVLSSIVITDQLDRHWSCSYLGWSGWWWAKWSFKLTKTGCNLDRETIIVLHLFDRVTRYFTIFSQNS